jgi:hypothetical protein
MPTDNDIDYRQFTRSDLLEALASIDAEQYPRNHQHLIAEIAWRDAGNKPEAPPERPARVLAILRLRGVVTRSLGTNILYGAFGAFYLCLPLFLIFGLHEPVKQPGWAALLIAMTWVVATFYLFGFCVTYKFESGVVKCLWFGRHIMWEDRLDTLQNVESDFIKGLPTIYFVWPDHRRRLWLRASDLDSANVIA